MGRRHEQSGDAMITSVLTKRWLRAERVRRAGADLPPGKGATRKVCAATVAGVAVITLGLTGVGAVRAAMHAQIWCSVRSLSWDLWPLPVLAAG